MFKNNPDKVKGLSAVLEFVIWRSGTGAECLATGLAEVAPSSAPPQAYERVAYDVVLSELAMQRTFFVRAGHVWEWFA